MSDRWKLLHQDCMRALPRLEAESCSLVLTDPPYGIRYKSWTGQSVANDDAPFIWFLREAFRITELPGALVCFSRWDVEQTWRDAITLAGFKCQSQLVWDKRVHTMGDCKAAFGASHEPAIFAIKQRRGASFAFPAGRPTTVLRYAKPPRSVRTHPTEKPVELLMHLIEHLTRPGDLVVDPFAGSGSTGEAALRTGRRFVGMELDPQHHANARKRLRNAEKGPCRRDVR